MVFIRCAYFLENYGRFIESVMAPESLFMSTITPLYHKIPMVSPLVNN